ncbi:MAG: YdcH family protein, partial [Proteobacteria bacterium]|nr:YdcH family protein [Pseudomonadota bacterium]
MSLDSNNPGEIAMMINHLREEHRDLDQAIAQLVTDPALDQLHLTR